MISEFDSTGLPRPVNGLQTGRAAGKLPALYSVDLYPVFWVLTAFYLTRITFSVL